MAVTLDDVSKYIHKHIGMEANYRNVTLSFNDVAWYVKASNKSRNAAISLKIKLMLEKLPKTIGHFECEGKHMFAPIETPQQLYKFTEAKASLIGNDVLEDLKRVLEKKQAFADELKNMIAIKKEFNLTD